MIFKRPGNNRNNGIFVIVFVLVLSLMTSSTDCKLLSTGKNNNKNNDIFKDWTVGDLKSFIKDHADEIKGSDTSKLLSENLLKSRDALSEKAADIWSTISERGEDLYSDTGDLLKEYRNEFFEKIYQQAKPSVKWYNKLNPLYYANTALKKRSLKGKGELIMQGLSEKGSDVYSTATKSGGSLMSEAYKSGESLASVASKSGQSIASDVSKGGKSLMSGASKSGESFASVASKTGQSLMSDVSKSGESIASVVSKSGESFATKASKSGKSMASDASKGGKSLMSDVSKSGESFASVASKTGQSLMSDASKSGESFATKASKSGHSMASDVSKSGGSMASDASKTAASLAARGTDGVKAASALTSEKLGYVSDWIFQSWDKLELQKFLKSQGIAVQDSMADSKDYLIELCHDNFDKISKNLETSGKYISDSYFTTWTTESYLDWLKKHNIKVEKKFRNSRDDLEKLVKKNMFLVSSKMDDYKMEVLKSLGIENIKNLFTSSISNNKKSKNISNVFQNWSIADLKKWFKLHELDWNYDMKKSNVQEIYSDAQKKYSKLIQDDGKWYLLKTFGKKKEYNPGFLTKSKDQVVSSFSGIYNFLNPFSYSNDHKNPDNIVNDTFLINVEHWPLKKIEQFLEARNIKYSQGTKKENLIALLKNNRNKKLVNFKSLPKNIKNSGKTPQDIIDEDENDTGFFHDWSLENLKKWVQDSKIGGAAEVVKEEENHSLLERANAKLSNVINNAHEDLSEYWESTFDKWSVDDLKNYVKSFGHASNYDDSKTSKKELLKAAKDNTLWFVSGGLYEREQDKSFWEKSKNNVVSSFKKILFINN